MFRCVLAFASIFALLGALSGCGVSKNLARRATRVAHVSGGKLLLQVAVSQAANENSPVAVDVVSIREKGFLKTAQGLPASEWFAKKNSLRRQNPKAMEIASWEWVPGQAIEAISIAIPVDAEAVIMFANYVSPGPHSAALPIGGKVSIALGEEDFTVDGK
jgi:type VI secretion system protein